MKRRALLATVVATSLLGGISWANVDATSRAALDKEVDQAMAGYNAKSPKEFYANWATMMKSIETGQAFKTLYVDMYQKNYGAYKSRTLIDAKSVVSTANGLMVYKAMFSKKPGTLSVNFIKEGSTFKIQQIQVNP